MYKPTGLAVGTNIGISIGMDDGHHGGGGNGDGDTFGAATEAGSPEMAKSKRSTGYHVRVWIGWSWAIRYSSTT